MSVIIIGGGGDGKHAIDRLVAASHAACLPADDRAVAQWLINQLIALANKPS